jgi:hypothetical protein
MRGRHMRDLMMDTFFYCLASAYLFFVSKPVQHDVALLVFLQDITVMIIIRNGFDL